MMSVNVKACLNCHEYVLINSASFKHQNGVKEFERDHGAHMLETMQYVDLGDGYTSRTSNYVRS
ncbi:hypothetical protein GF325_10660 [Candidatus Bathyarchaeota archaeon]|nr:hypothetical protein [Candidatus Bathyarchaeota archaeon]